MADQIQSLLANVRCYAERRESLLDLESPIGYGTDGIVWKTATTAIKAFYRQRNFLNELSCYERLKQRNAPDAIQGFWVPRLVGHDHRVQSGWCAGFAAFWPSYLARFGESSAWLLSRMP